MMAEIECVTSVRWIYFDYFITYLSILLVTYYTYTYQPDLWSG